MKKGFTLVELLAVLALLSLILGLVTYNAIEYYNKRKQQDYQDVMLLIQKNAKLYVEATNKNISKTVDDNIASYNECILSYDTLVDNKLMDEDTIDPLTREKLYNNNKYIIVSLSDNDELEYTYFEGDDISKYQNCLNGLE